MEVSAAFRHQSRACAELGSPMYAELLARCADDLDGGGVLRDVLIGHEDDPGPSALALRLLGSVHRLVLERRAGELAAFYPSVGGTWDTEGGWRAFARLLEQEPEAVVAWLDRPPQTNEVGRSSALFGGLLHLARDLPVRLLEIGSSGGLNLRADRYTYLDDAGRRFGAPGDDVVLAGAWCGRRLEPWPELEVVERLGSDVMPVDVGTTEGRLVLTAYVWPDQGTRLERLRSALRLAHLVPAEVRRQDAAAFLAATQLREGTTTVLWHSVMWQYLTDEDKRLAAARIAELGAAATPTRRFAHLRAEPARRTPQAAHEFLVRLTTWPGGEDRHLGATVGHGIPTTWE
jgi:hypothetical protein